jgi:hypothetical protein
MQFNILQLHLNGLMSFFIFLELLTSLCTWLKSSTLSFLKTLLMNCIYIHYSFLKWMYKNLGSLTFILSG